MLYADSKVHVKGINDMRINYIDHISLNVSGLYEVDLMIHIQRFNVTTTIATATILGGSIIIVVGKIYIISIITRVKPNSLVGIYVRDD